VDLSGREGTSVHPNSNRCVPPDDCLSPKGSLLQSDVGQIMLRGWGVRYIHLRLGRLRHDSHVGTPDVDSCTDLGPS